MVALSATSQSNILFPAPSSYLGHAEFTLLETTSVLDAGRSVQKGWTSAGGFLPLLGQMGPSLGCAGRRGRGCGALWPCARQQRSACSTSPCRPQRGKGWNHGSVPLWHTSFLEGKCIISWTDQLSSSWHKAFLVPIIEGLGLGQDPIWRKKTPQTHSNLIMRNDTNTITVDIQLWQTADAGASEGTRQRPQGASLPAPVVITCHLTLMPDSLLLPTLQTLLRETSINLLPLP